jgi:hypothetical protein
MLRVRALGSEAKKTECREQKRDSLIQMHAPIASFFRMEKEPIGSCAFAFVVSVLSLILSLCYRFTRVR